MPQQRQHRRLSCPVLAGESARRTHSFIESRISSDPAQVEKFHEQYGQSELMPHPRVAPEAARDLAAYIMQIPVPPGGLNVHGHTAGKTVPQMSETNMTSSARIDAGKRLVFEKGCLSCHSVGGMGGGLAPSFDGIGSRKTPAEIAGQITKAQLMVGPEGEYQERGIVMFTPDLSDHEIADITSFLSARK